MENKDELIETLQHAVDAENMSHYCCSHLTSLIKNGRIKDKFNSFADSARSNKGLLIEHLKGLGVNNYLPQNKCKFCNIKAESFSLLGAVNLGLEVTDAAIKLYKKLLGLTDDNEDKKRLKEILNEKDAERASFKEEKKFVSKGDTGINCIDSYCIPDVISKLWK